MIFCFVPLSSSLFIWAFWTIVLLGSRLPEAGLLNANDSLVLRKECTVGVVRVLAGKIGCAEALV